MKQVDRRFVFLLSGPGIFNLLGPKNWAVKTRLTTSTGLSYEKLVVCAWPFSTAGRARRQLLLQSVALTAPERQLVDEEPRNPLCATRELPNCRHKQDTDLLPLGCIQLGCEA